MKMPFVKTTWEASIRANALLSLTALVLSIVTAMVVMKSQGQHERIVLTPMVVDKQMSVAWTSADESYIKAFGLSVAELVGNMTPANVNFVLEAMSRFISPAIYPDLRKKILSITDLRQFREASAATRFVPQQVTYEPETQKLFVFGEVEVSTSLGHEKNIMTYEMTIRIEGGQPIVSSFDNYSAAPHLKEWVDEQQRLADQQAAKKQADGGGK